MKLVNIQRGWILFGIMVGVGMLVGGLRAMQATEPEKIPVSAASASSSAAALSGLREERSASSAEETKSAKIDDFSQLGTWFKLPRFNKGLPVKGEQYTTVSQRYGNKTVNLCVLSILAETINEVVLQNSAYKMAVPAFCAVGNDTIIEYLNTVKQAFGDGGFDALWKRFVEAQGTSPVLQENAATILGDMRTGIRRAFSDKVPQAIGVVIERFIQQNKNCLFMVRSTGLEDRVDMANAGGNESKSSVQPDVDAIWHAMGEVVESYFSEKSIKQRLLAGDNVTARYFIPVLLQRMIGEAAWNGENPETLTSIPVSGVMFTELAEVTGSGVVQVQSAYGHNQGVVNSLVAVDTFYMGSSGVIYPVIRKKTQRLVTMAVEGGNELRPVENYVFEKGVAKDIAMQTAPSLSPSILGTLKKIADYVHQTYNHAMDIEFVVQDGTIYLVQARPLIHLTAGKEPSYLKDAFVSSINEGKEGKAAAVAEEIKESKEEKKTAVVTTIKAATVLTGFSIGVGGGYVRVIDDPAQIIVRDDIGQALDAYHDNQQRDKVQAIIIKKAAPSTSHEATQFRSYGLPVMVFAADRVQAIDQLLNNLSGRKLLVDPQRGVVALTNEGMALAAIAPGWYTHPIPLEVSVLPKFYLAKESALGGEIENYADALRWDSGQDEDDVNVSMRQLLAAIKRGASRDKLVTNLKIIMHRLGNFARQESSFESLQWEATWLVGAATVFACDVLYTFDDLKKESKPSEQEQRLAFLYPIKFLEALIMQQPDADVVDGFSYALLRKGAKEDNEKTLALMKRQGKYLKQAAPEMVEYAVQCMKIQTIALNDTVRSQWELFINGLVRASLAAKEQDQPVYGNAIKQLATMIGQLGNLGILEAWLHTSFAEAWKESRKAKVHALACAKWLMDEISGKGAAEQVEEKETKEAKEAAPATVTNKEIIAWIAKQAQMVAACERRINEWSSPEQFNALLKQFGIAHTLCVPAGSEGAFKDLMFEKGVIRNSATKIGLVNREKSAAFYQELKAYVQKYSPCVQKFHQAGRLGRLALISFFKKTIDVFDRTIKAMTGSPQYTDKNLLAKNFATILPYYLTLMEQLLTLIPAKQEAKLMPIDERVGSVNWNFANYVAGIRRIFNDCYQQAQQGTGSALVLASSDFSVAAAQIGSKVDFDRANPQSLEDCFMLMHQNMLTTTSVLNKLYGISSQQLPALVQALGSEIEKIKVSEYGKFLDFKANIVGIDYTFPCLIVDYNLPLRQHSSMFRITWNGQKSPKQVTLAARFLGHNEKDRMNGICAYAGIASFSLGLAFDQVPRTTAEYGKGGKNVSEQTDFSWVVKEDANLMAIRLSLQQMANATMNFSGVVGLMLQQMHEEVQPIFTTDQASEVAKKTQPLDEKEALTIYQGLPKFPDSFFTNSLFCNGWFISIYMDAAQYEQALRVIRLSLDTIALQNNFRFESHVVLGLSLLDYCLKTLDTLMDRQDLQQQVYEILLQTFSRRKLVDFMAAKNYEQALKRVFRMYSIRHDKESLSLLDQVVKNPEGATFWLKKYEDKGSQAILKAIADEQHIAAADYHRALYTNVFNALEKLVRERYLNDARSIPCAYGLRLVIAWIRYGDAFPDNYSRAEHIAQALIASKKVYTDEDWIPGLGYRDIPAKGFQYTKAGEIAKALIDAGQKTHAQAILQALEQLRKEGSFDTETLTVLDGVIKDLSASLQP